MSLSFNERRSINQNLNANCNLYFSVLSSLLLLFFRSIISIFTKQCSARSVVQTVEFSVPIWTDVGGFRNPIKSIQQRAWSLWCEGSWETRRDEFVWQNFLEAFIFARLVDKVKNKKKKSLKTFCTLMKNSFDIYFCCFLLSC